MMTYGNVLSLNLFELVVILEEVATDRWGQLSLAVSYYCASSADAQTASLKTRIRDVEHGNTN